MKEELLDKYARLIIEIGVNLQKGQLLVLNTPVCCTAFARRIAQAAYAAGAHDVVPCWHDENFARLRYLKAPQAVFSEYAEWRRLLYTDYAEQGAAFVSISADDPQIFQGVAPERLLAAQQSAGAALLEYRQRLMNNENSWCVVSVPTPAWAGRVFPEAGKQAEEALWQAVLSAVHVSLDSDPVAEWHRHTGFLQQAADFMNEQRFVSLHYRNSLGTDLIVRLPQGHIWAGGAEENTSGVAFVANMPTEEVYTVPEREGTEGTVFATKPLNYNGNIIDGIKLEFRQGKVVSASARCGEEYLQQLLAVDEGASYLGEAALVPFDSPISQSGILFFNTLFDENASCHLALGKAYPTCLAGGQAMESVELLQHGVNDSLVHEDFMIGSRDLSIVGCTASGEHLTVFERGNFAFPRA